MVRMTNIITSRGRVHFGNNNDKVFTRISFEQKGKYIRTNLKDNEPVAVV